MPSVEPNDGGGGPGCPDGNVENYCMFYRSGYSSANGYINDASNANNLNAICEIDINPSPTASFSNSAT